MKDRLYYRNCTPNSTPLLYKYTDRDYCYKSKLGRRQYIKWRIETYPHTYKDVKEGDCFIVFNGGNNPVPFVQLKGEEIDNNNRPTRLLDGCYYSLNSDHPIAIVSKEICINLKKELNNIL